jgi:hypothetical protein
MKIKLIATYLMIYHISSFASQHRPSIQTFEQLPPAMAMWSWEDNFLHEKIEIIPRTQGLGTSGAQTLTEMLRLEKLAHKKEVEKNKNYPKLSQKELNEWIKAKELEIKENQAKAAHKINLKNHKEHVISYVYSEGFNIIKHCMLQNHRKQYNSPIKRITCYPPKLLLEYKK